MKLNLITAATAFLFTFLFNLGNNTFFTSTYRAIIGFVLFFFIMFPVRWMIQVFGQHQRHTDAEGILEQDGERMSGANFNAVLPEEDPLPLMQASARSRPSNPGSSMETDDEFVPLFSQPGKSTVATVNPKNIANAVRTFSNQ